MKRAATVAIWLLVLLLIITGCSAAPTPAVGRLAGDVVAGVDYLRSRPDVERVGLFGYTGAAAAARRALAGQGVPPASIDAQLPHLTSRYFRAFVVHDPAPSLDALAVPVLAFYGGKDLQVPADQSVPAMRARLADNPDVTIKTFPGLNHLMQPATTGALTEYATIETTLAPEVLDLITQWLKQRYPAG